MKYALLGLALFLSAPSAHAFVDVMFNHPQFDAIEYAEQQKIVEGYQDGTFRSDWAINRAEFTKIITVAKAGGLPREGAEACFKDMTGEEWFATTVCWAWGIRAITGYPDGTFRPGNYINFAEAAKIIVNIFDPHGMSPVPAGQPWYRPFVQYLGEHDAIPTSITSFDQYLTRGEMVDIIYRLQTGTTDKPSTSYLQLSGENETHCQNGTCYISASLESHCSSAGCSNVSITVDDTYRYIKGNGLPNHVTGKFPNAGNPNTIAEQSVEYRVPVNPTYSAHAFSAQVPGVALNGVFFEPGTAERNGNYSYEALQDSLNLGLDSNYAHVQPNGAYHYHSVPTELVEELQPFSKGDLVQVGWAADGFAMYYSLNNEYKSSYVLKSGSRTANPPGGFYDGTYTQDWEYQDGAGNLDDCNGTWLGKEYAYILTHEFPYIPRCLHGVADSSFEKNHGSLGGPHGQNRPPAHDTDAHGPPQEAIVACNGKFSGFSCSFQAPHGTVSGTCQQTPEGEVACVPNG